MPSFASRARRVRLASTLVALGALGTGCAQPSRYSSTPVPNPAESAALGATSTRQPLGRAGTEARASRYTILPSEMAGIPANNAYDIVFRLRPELLHPSTRRASSAAREEPIVYIDALKAGPLSTLMEVPAKSVMQITYLTPMDALLVYGPTHRAGVIVVRTSR